MYCHEKLFIHEIKQQERKQRAKDLQNRKQQNDNIKSLPIINYLNENELNSPIKTQRMTEWLKTQNPIICCLQETHFSFRAHVDWDWMGWKKSFQLNSNQKKEGVAQLTSGKIDFKLKMVKKEKEDNYDKRVNPSGRSNNYK